MGVLFMAQLTTRTDFNPQGSTPSNGYSRAYNIYEFYIGNYPARSYWLDWGGRYDNIIAKKIELYFGQWLQNAFTKANLLDTMNSFLVLGDFVYFHIPKHPWLYSDEELQVRKTDGFVSGPLDESNPSNQLVEGEYLPALLEKPQVSVKLSDVISGLTKYSTFDFTLANNDGKFDMSRALDYFNAPAYI